MSWGLRWGRMWSHDPVAGPPVDVYRRLYAVAGAYGLAYDAGRTDRAYYQALEPAFFQAQADYYKLRTRSYTSVVNGKLKVRLSRPGAFLALLLDALERPIGAAWSTTVGERHLVSLPPLPPGSRVKVVLVPVEGSVVTDGSDETYVEADPLNPVPDAAFFNGAYTDPLDPRAYFDGVYVFDGTLTFGGE